MPATASAAGEVALVGETPGLVSGLRASSTTTSSTTAWSAWAEAAFRRAHHVDGQGPGELGGDLVANAHVAQHHVGHLGHAELRQRRNVKGEDHRSALAAVGVTESELHAAGHRGGRVAVQHLDEVHVVAWADLDADVLGHDTGQALELLGEDGRGGVGGGAKWALPPPASPMAVRRSSAKWSPKPMVVCPHRLLVPRSPCPPGRQGR